MSKKPRKSRHRAAPVPWYTPKPVVLDESYAHEVERSTSKLEQQYATALRRAESAEARARRAEAKAKEVSASAAMRRAAEQVRAEAERLWLEFDALDRQVRQVPHQSGRGRVDRVGPGGSGGGKLRSYVKPVPIAQQNQEAAPHG